MASCDDDFSLLSDDANPNNHHHHHHILYAPPRQIHAPPHSLLPSSGSAAEQQQQLQNDDVEDDDDDDVSDSAFSDTSSVRKTSEKRKPDDTASDNNNNNNNNSSKQNDTPYSNYKKARQSAADYRKDREEWSDAAIECLLTAYTEKFAALNRGNLRGRDWEEVAAIVSERCEKQSKTVEQCKNKVDNLKKRYKLEKHRMSNGGLTASHWPWFKKMEEIVGNSLSIKGGNDEFKGGSSGGGGSSGDIVVRQSKRYATAIASPISQTNNMKSKSMCSIRWRRVVLKISGVALAGSGPNNVDPKVIMLIAREVAIACRLGVEVAIVLGCRNFFRGDTWVTATGSDRRTAYQISMMASVMNSVLLQSVLEKAGVQTRVQTAFTVQEVAEPYNRQKAIRHLEKGRVVIFGGLGAGVGNSLFSTDSAAAFQASEIHAEAVLKGTNVDGVYDCHSRDSNVTFEHISFRDLVSRGATSMDMMALTYCEENGIPVVVFNLLEPGNISKALCGEQVGTLIDQTGSLS